MAKRGSSKVMAVSGHGVGVLRKKQRGNRARKTR